MAARTIARRVRAYMKKHPNATPKKIAEDLGVSVANVYYVRKHDKVVDLTAAGSPLHPLVNEMMLPANPRLYPPAPARPKTRMQGTRDFEFGNSNVDLVNQPPHYKVGGIETIDFIEAKQLNYNLGNAVKYISRADHKGNRIEDLQKAKWYIEREILAQHI